MAGNTFNNAAGYLYAYTGTLSFEAWREVVKQAFTELKEEFGSLDAGQKIRQMTAYYCLEVGGSYKGEVAASKFRRCYRWSDFKEAFSDKENLLFNRWNEMRATDNEIAQKRLHLAARVIAPNQLVHESRSREAVRVVIHEIVRRHGMQVANASQGWVRELVSIYGSEVFLKMSRETDEFGAWKRSLLSNRDLIPNMLTSYFIERAIYRLYGSRIDAMKAYSLSDLDRSDQ